MGNDVLWYGINRQSRVALRRTEHPSPPWAELIYWLIKQSAKIKQKYLMEVNHYNWKQLIGLLCLLIEQHVKNFKVHRRTTFNLCQPWNFLNFAATFDFSVSLLIAGLVRLDRFFSSQKSNEIEHFIPVSPTKTVCVHSKCVFRPTEPYEHKELFVIGKPRNIWVHKKISRHPAQWN